jgi:hypothetical protein
MLVDVERVLLDLKRHIAGKSHHGQRELLSAIAQLEVAHRIEESLPERALRLYGWAFFEEAIRMPGSEQASVSARDGEQVRASRGDSHDESKEDTHAFTRGTDPAGVTAARDREHPPRRVPAAAR